MNYWMGVATLTGIYMIAILGVSILTGFTGLFLSLIHILIRFPKIIGLHPDPGRKYLADVGAVHKSQNFRQFLHGQVGVKQEVDGFSHPHLI